MFLKVGIFRFKIGFNFRFELVSFLSQCEFLWAFYYTTTYLAFKELEFELRVEGKFGELQVGAGRRLLDDALPEKMGQKMGQKMGWNNMACFTGERSPSTWHN